MPKMMLIIDEEPESCIDCDLSYCDLNDDIVCIDNEYNIEEFAEKRAPFCPLLPFEEDDE